MKDFAIDFPIRINRYLAKKNYCTRRQADEWIVQGRVLVNSKPAKIGQQISSEDQVKVSPKKLAEVARDRVYFVFNKPANVLTHGPRQKGAKLVEDFLKRIKEDVFPIGRLDKDSHGLLILTNDGRITDRLLNPKYNNEKEYRVRVNKPTTANFFTRMSKGIKLEDGYITRRARLAGEPGGKIFRIIIQEGKKHQIRRMCTALGYEVLDVGRMRVSNIKLSGLEEGKVRPIRGKELKVFLKSLGMIK